MAITSQRQRKAGNEGDTDPVEVAKGLVKEADDALTTARNALFDAKLRLLVTKPLIVEVNGQSRGVLAGNLMVADEWHQLAYQNVISCKHTYDHAWHQREQAREHLAQMVRQHQRGKQESYVRLHQPALPEAVDYWSEKLRTATSDHQHAEAKKNHAQAMHAWQTAILSAPTQE